MRDDQKRLQNLKNKLVNLEIERASVEHNIYRINNEYHSLMENHKELVFNIDFLKQEEIIVSAVEYKRSINNLNYVKNRIDRLNREYVKNIDSLVKLNDSIEITNKDIEEQQDLCDQYVVVLQFPKRGSFEE